MSFSRIRPAWLPLFMLSMALVLLPVPRLAAAATGLDPAVRSRVERASQLVEQGKLDEAIRIYNSIIDARPELLFAYNNLAVIYARQGRLEDAAATLKKGIASDPEFASLYNNLTHIYLELSRKDYGKALRLDDKPGELALQTIPPPAVASTDNKAQDKPAIPAKQATASADNNRDELRLVVQGWAAAWSAQDTDKYLSYYAEDFVPGKGMSRRDWLNQRRQRLRRPRWVQVTLSDIRVRRLVNDRMQVRFLQHYRSDSYEDRTRKQLILTRTPQGWKIVQEKSL